MKNLYIIGAGGFGREVVWLAERINEITPTWKIKGFVDDNPLLWNSVLDGYEVIGGCDYLIKTAASEETYAVCAVGTAAARKMIIEKLKDSSVKYATLIDPSVLVSNRVKIEPGTIICAGTTLTVDIKIGHHVIVNLDCTLGHDTILHDFVTVYPNVSISGNVEVGMYSELGTGTQIIQGKKISAGTIIGAGAVVVKNIEEKGTYVGNPAKKMK